MIEWITLTPDLHVAHIGPSLDLGPLPTVLYFALSAQESLALDPFNQPALFLANKGIRVFSLSLPDHGPDLNALDAIGTWARRVKSGEDPFSLFFNAISTAIDLFINKGWSVREQIGVMGLSRGGWVALHSLARSPIIHSAVGFAPLIELSKTQEFLREQVKINTSFDIPLPPLFDRPIRLYIGNRDTRVGTRQCFDFTQRLVETSFTNSRRSAPVELIISPSIGHMGHGTSKEIFTDGALWLARKLGAMQ